MNERLSALGYEPAVAAAELLVSELVTNAILHARTPIDVAVVARGGVVWVGVGDGSLRAPRLREGGVGSVSGRGLVVVDKIATRWGVDDRYGGKVVWFELPRTPADEFDGPVDDWEL